MNRLHGSGYREAIEEARSYLTDQMNDRLAHVGFVCGISPIFIGLRDPGDVTFYNGLVMSYADLAATWSGRYHGLLDDQTTIVFPRIDLYQPWEVSTIAHELGHALHETIGWIDVAKPTTPYSYTNHREAFAEAFMLWAARDACPPWDRDLAVDPEATALFERLSG